MKAFSSGKKRRKSEEGSSVILNKEAKKNRHNTELQCYKSTEVAEIE